jgi:hypothetical protein
MTIDKQVDEESLHDVVRGAMEDTAGEVSDEVTQGPAATSSRDENGRFQPKNVSEAATAPVTEGAGEPAAVEGGRWTPERPPSSWKPKAREHWNSLPLEIREEITRREEDAMNGSRRLQEQFAPLKELQQHMTPIVQELQRIGVSPQQHIDAVMTTERVLRTADLPTKFEALLGIADQYGIPLRQIINKSVGQEVLQSPARTQIPDEIRQELQEIRSWREQQEQSIVNNDVASFGSQQEFFHDVRHTMADLIERGIAADLQSAYDQAVWMNPEIRGILVARQARPSQPTVQSRQTRAAGASIRPTGSISVPADDDGEESLGDTIRKAMNSAQRGL